LNYARVAARWAILQEPEMPFDMKGVAGKWLGFLKEMVPFVMRAAPDVQFGDRYLF
jgi:hypothetical protein